MIVQSHHNNQNPILNHNFNFHHSNSINLTGDNPSKKTLLPVESPTNHIWTEAKAKNKAILKRNNHISVIYQDKLYIHGGYDIHTGALSDFHCIQIEDNYEMNNWTPIEVKSTANPGALQRHTGIVHNDSLYLYGGQRQNTKNTNNLWRFDFNTSKWNLIENYESSKTAPYLDSHRCNLYIDNERNSSLIISCGYLGDICEYTNQVYKFDFENKKWTILYKNSINNILNAPLPRGGHGAAIHADSLYIFGGADGDLRFNDLWKFDLISCIWNEVKVNNQPEPRSGHSMVLYNEQYFVIFGGIQEITRERDDIIAFDVKANDWLVIQKASTLVNSISPPKKSVSNPFDFEKYVTKTIDKTLPYQTTTINEKIIMRTRSKSKTVAPARHFPTHPTPKRRMDTLSKDTSPYIKTEKDCSLTNINNGSFEKLPSSGGGSSALKATKEEKRKRIFLMKKNMLLSKFEITDPEEKIRLQIKSPTTEAMKNSISAFNYKRNGNGITSLIGLSPNDEKKKGLSETSYYDSFHLPSMHTTSPKDKKHMHKPCARDGHTAVVYKEKKMIVFGGDRHKMSFNDIYILDLEKAIKHFRLANIDDDHSPIQPELIEFGNLRLGIQGLGQGLSQITLTNSTFFFAVVLVVIL